MAGFKEDAIDIDHAATFTQADDGALTLANGILWGNCFVEGCDGQYRPDSSDPEGRTTSAVVDASDDILIEDPDNPDLAHPQIGGNAGCGYRCMFNLESPNFIPTDDSPAVMGTVPPATPPNDGFFEVTRLHRRRGAGGLVPEQLVGGVDRLLDELAVRRRVAADGGLAGRGALVRLVRCFAIAAVCAMGGCGGDYDTHTRLSPLQRTFSSPEALSDAVLAALAARDADTLSSLRSTSWSSAPSSGRSCRRAGRSGAYRSTTPGGISTRRAGTRCGGCWRATAESGTSASPLRSLEKRPRTGPSESIARRSWTCATRTATI